MQLDDFGVPQLKVVLCFINLFLILAVLAVVWRSNDGLASPKWCSERRSVVAGHGQDVLRWVRPVAFGRGQSLTQKKPTDISASIQRPSKNHPTWSHTTALGTGVRATSIPSPLLKTCRFGGYGTKSLVVPFGTNTDYWVHHDWFGTSWHLGVGNQSILAGSWCFHFRTF